MIYQILVTCCDHPGNGPGKGFDVPRVIWGALWSSEEEFREATLTVSQQVPVSDDRRQAGRPAGPVWARDDGTSVRGRIRESCAACGSPLVMRDTTWDTLSRRLERFDGLWVAAGELDGQPWVQGVISLPVLQPLVEEMRRRQAW